MTAGGSTLEPEAGPARRTLALSYGSGLLAMGQMDAILFIVPIWAVFLGASATEVGILVGARSVLPCLFAIHGGVLMDRLGARRVTAFFVVMTGFLIALYPALPWFFPLLIIQMFTGLAFSLSWVGAQTMIAQISKGETHYLGQFSFAARLGTFIAPVMMGLLWDLTNPWVTFISVSVWAAALFAMLLVMPETAETRPPAVPTPWRDLMPKLSEYKATLALLAVPAIAITVAAGLIRVSTSAMQTSMYVVYLEQIGLTGTLIGILFSAIEGASGLGSLFAGPAGKRVPAYALMFTTTALAVTLMAVTPLLGGIFLALFAVQAVRGFLQGVAHPVLFSIQSRAVGPTHQGAMVALRVTSNRVGAVVIPPAVGIIADTLGIAESFYLLGAGMLAAIAVLIVVSRPYRTKGT